jgi:hypothetical protein
MTDTEPRRLYGYKELADRIGAKVGTVRVMAHRKQLPEPDERLAAGPVWYADTIDKWVADR